jgi:hypothetical protein
MKYKVGDVFESTNVEGDKIIVKIQSAGPNSCLFESVLPGVTNNGGWEWPNALQNDAIDRKQNAMFLMELLNPSEFPEYYV